MSQLLDAGLLSDFTRLEIHFQSEPTWSGNPDLVNQSLKHTYNLRSELHSGCYLQTHPQTFRVKVHRVYQ